MAISETVERKVRSGHHMLAHLRTEAYPVYRRHFFPPEARSAGLSYAENVARTEAVKRHLA